MAQKNILMIVALLSIMQNGACYTAGPVNTQYSTIDFPHDQAYLNTTRPTFIGTLLNDKRKPVIGQTVQIYINNVEIGTTLSNNNGIYQFQPEQAIIDGSYEISAVCVEAQVILGPHQFVIDTTLPTISISYPQENAILLNNTFTVSGTTEENASVETFLDNDTYGNICYADQSGNWSIEYSAANGAHTIVVQATDLAGNQGPASDVRNFTVNA